MKAIFKFELIGKNELKVKLVHVCDTVVNITDNYDGNYFYDEIMIWSLRTFTFDERQIRLPQLSELSDKMVHTHKFESEQERYETLKKFYISLNRWSLDTKLFPNNNLDNTKRVLIQDKYWTVM
ncbi:MAG: hypothetical protein ACOC3V_00700 [bacterium]